MNAMGARQPIRVPEGSLTINLGLGGGNAHNGSGWPEPSVDRVIAAKPMGRRPRGAVESERRTVCRMLGRRASHPMVFGGSPTWLMTCAQHSIRVILSPPFEGGP
jgi:hypothetical protein